MSDDTTATKKPCEHNWYTSIPGHILYCIRCNENHGPVEALIEAKKSMEQYGKDAQRVLDLRIQVATLTRERDEARDRANCLDACMHGWKCNAERAERDVTTARARIAELENGIKFTFSQEFPPTHLDHWDELRLALDDNKGLSWNKCLEAVRGLRVRIAELERERNTFNEGVWDRAVRSTLERLRDHMNFLENEVTP